VLAGESENWILGLVNGGIFITCEKKKTYKIDALATSAVLDASAFLQAKNELNLIEKELEYVLEELRLRHACID
jgi:hypothetical protein